jgi:hypothetical protein
VRCVYSCTSISPIGYVYSTPYWGMIAATRNVRAIRRPPRGASSLCLSVASRRARARPHDGTKADRHRKPELRLQACVSGSHLRQEHTHSHAVTTPTDSK